MSERILVAVAWPYANGSMHIGQAAGAYLPADIFARYHRMKGNEVLMVSGTDSHGTPVTLEAEKRGVSPEEVFSAYHDEFLNNWQRLGISFDLFTSTHTDNHVAVVQDMFLTLQKKGFIYKAIMSQPYCSTDSRFLADRYVGGECPHCGFDAAKGDQCDNCGRTLDPEELLGIKCLLCGDSPVFKDTEHFFFRLTAFGDQIHDWIEPREHWRPNVRNLSLGFLDGGLQDSAITRDIGWGVPVPLDGYEGKRIYVWFEAVIGYLSASIEWAKASGDETKWQDFWQKDCKAYYFMGKDNIPFHTIRWPAMLMGYGGLNLPYDIPANEYLVLEGLKVSTSRNWAVWLPDYLERYEPDPLRFVVTANMPETSDSDFSWREYVRCNNDELVATYGNLVHRVLTMTVRYFDAKVPQPGEMDDQAVTMLQEAAKRLAETGSNIELCKFRFGLEASMALARSANRYLDLKAPWQAIRRDRGDAATTLWVSLAVLNCLKTALYPFLPFSSEKLHTMLGLEDTIQSGGWAWSEDSLVPGQKINNPVPLFAKLDEAIIEQETEKIGH